MPDKGNLQATNNRGCGTEVWTEKRDRIDGLETVSMTELYDTVYPPKIPIVDGLIYAGTRKLNISMERLFVDYGIRYESKRGHSSRMIKLTLEQRA